MTHRAFLALPALLLISGIAYAQSSLTGSVVGRDNNPKPNLSVDLVGPTTVYTRTDSVGKFSVRLRPGRYVVRIRDYQRRYEFRQDVGPGQNNARYVVPW